ncbi:MAG: hypothetical protein M9926_08550 [Lentimicrobium sp.]|uniref:hypothetical protein n=1 Tax=Lentimicrobium sp. TaxID=2034841 RepID=UPI0025EBB243|nr:hypothetical protein [Lentimicrobium sp.]MCO5256796.1 hypothetical protein [Lentimicrobium sp.]
MAKSLIVYQADQEVIGEQIYSTEWVMYSGKLTIYDRKINPIVLNPKSEISATYLKNSWKIKRSSKVIRFQKYMGKW